MKELSLAAATTLLAVTLSAVLVVRRTVTGSRTAHPITPSIFVGRPAPRTPFLLLATAAVLPSPMLVAAKLGLVYGRSALSLLKDVDLGRVRVTAVDLE